MIMHIIKATYMRYYAHTMVHTTRTHVITTITITPPCMKGQ